MYKTKQIESDRWKKFLLDQKFTPFVQSPKFGEFYNKREEDYWVFGVFENEELIGGSLVVSTHAKRGDFLYLPYGPVLNFSNDNAVSSLFSKLEKFADNTGYDFLRVSPMRENTDENQKALENIGFQQAPMHIIAETSWILDLSDKQEDKKMLMNMKKNHRNMIRRCMRKDVTVEQRTDQEALEELNDMHDIVAEKHDFERFPRSYINNEFETFAKDNQAKIFHAYLPNGELDSSAIIIFYGNMAVYRHSASLRKNNKLSTSYFIQWKALQEAKKRGIRWYNFWGIAPEDADDDHPFYGITRFKKGFGGFRTDYIPCHDLPISWKYSLNWGVEKIRKYKRGF